MLGGGSVIYFVTNLRIKPAGSGAFPSSSNKHLDPKRNRKEKGECGRGIGVQAQRSLREGGEGVCFGEWQ